MTTFLLIRHAQNDMIGKTLASRMPGVHLNGAGFIQAEALVERLKTTRIDAIYSSPLERAMETAAPLARSRGLAVTPREGLTEIEFGVWTGCDIATLDPDPLWQRFNRFRSGTRAPGGELMTEAEVRMMDELEWMRTRHRGESVAVFSHADVIRAAIMHCTGMPLDLFQRIEISPASVSVLEFGDNRPCVTLLNETGTIGVRRPG